MSSPATYEIHILGKLSPQWAEWFNGTLQDQALVDQGQPITNLICQVRDQAELIGIIKQLNALNLPLIQVCLLKGCRDNQEVRK